MFWKLSRFTTIASGVSIGSWMFHLTQPGELLFNLQKVNCNSIPSPPVESNLELIHVQIFFRHGARTPLHSVSSGDPEMVALWDPDLFLTKSSAACNFPVNHLSMDVSEVSSVSLLEKYYNSKILSGGARIGQLTRHGQEQLLQLGLLLRKHYVDQLEFISPKEKPEEIYCRSTRISRNIESTTCLLAGLFNFEQPIDRKYPTMYSCNLEIENLIPNRHACKVLNELHDRGIASLKEISNISDVYQELKDSLSVERVHCDICNSEHDTLHYSRDDFVSRDYHGFYLPKSLKNILPQIEKIAVEEFMYRFFGGPLESNFSSIKYIAGNLIEMILNNISASKSNLLKEKFHLYATHDSMLIPLLVFLDIFDDKWPPYAADLRIEVYRDRSTGEHWCQMLYLGEPKIPAFYPVDDEKSNYSNSNYLFPLECLETRLRLYAMDIKSYYKICGYIEENKKFTESERPAGM